MGNRFSAENIKFTQSITGASGHLDVLFLDDNLAWQDTTPRKLEGLGDHIYHDGDRLLKEGELPSIGVGTAVTASTASGIRVEVNQANLFQTGDIIRHDPALQYYVKSISSGKETAEVVGVVDTVSGHTSILKDDGPYNRSAESYYVGGGGGGGPARVHDSTSTKIHASKENKIYGPTSLRLSEESNGYIAVDYYSSADTFFLDSGDFTIEFWFNSTTGLTGLTDIFGNYVNQIALTDFSEGVVTPKVRGAGSFEIELTTGRAVRGRFHANNGSTISLATPNDYYAWNSWNHVALQRKNTDLSGVMTLWFNGSTGGGGQRLLEIDKETKMIDSRGAAASHGLTLGKAAELWQAESFDGFIDELRYSVGTGRYAGTFKSERKKKPFASDQNTELLMHFDSGNSYFRYVGHGIIDGLTGLSPGSVYFLSTTEEGAYSLNESYLIGHISKPVFTALSENFAYVHNYRGIEVSDISDSFFVKWAPYVPLSTTHPGEKGTVIYDEHYWYVCTATNNWKRTAIGTW